MRTLRRPALLVITMAFLLAIGLLIPLRLYLRATKVSAGAWRPDAGIDTADIHSVSQSVTACSRRQTPNCLENFAPSFETDEYNKYWCTWEMTGCSYLRDDHPYAYDGQYSLRVQGSDNGLPCYWRTHNQELPDFFLSAEHYYYFSGRIRTEFLEHDAEAYIMLRFWGSDDRSQRVPSNKVTINTAEIPGDEEDKWVSVCGVAEVPSWADRTRIECRLDGEGYAWCDDLFLGLDVAPGLTKSAFPTQVAPGDLLTYTITYSNAGMEPADVRICEYLRPNAGGADVGFVAATPQPDNHPGDDTFEMWTIGTLAQTTESIVAIFRVSSDTHKSCLVNLATMENTSYMPYSGLVKLERSASTTVAITNERACEIDIWSSPDERVVTSPGEEILSHKVHNCGGITTDITVTVSATPTWIVTPLETLVHSLPPSKTTGVPVTLTVPEGVPSGTRGALVWSATASCGDSASVTDTIRIESRPKASFLPTVMKQYTPPPPCDLCADPVGYPCNSDGQDPYEPNDVYCSTRTRLVPGVRVQAPMCPGYSDDPGDWKDYYYIYIDNLTGGTLDIWLEDLPDDYGLGLYHESGCSLANYDCTDPVSWSNNPDRADEHVTYTVPPDGKGCYYVRVYRDPDYPSECSWDPYTLSFDLLSATAGN